MSDFEDQHERKLRDLVREAGGEAERRAPAFQRTWRAACEAQNTGESAAASARLKWAFAAALIVVAALAVVMMTHHGDANRAVAGREDHAALPAPTTTDGLEQEAPTDFLLAANREPTAPPVEQLAHEIDALLRP